jgi:hypothetical protein
MNEPRNPLSRHILLVVIMAALTSVMLACGSDSSDVESTPSSTRSPGENQQSPSSTSLAINNVEKVVLFEVDMPVEFSQVQEGTAHLSADDVCGRGSPDEKAKQECLKFMQDWGRMDTYQVTFRSNNPLAPLAGSGTFEVLNISSVHRDKEGASKAFAWGKEQLQERLEQSKDARLVPAPTVGEESVAFVVDSNDFYAGQIIMLSYYSIDFRRGNVLVRVATVAPKVLAKMDDVLAFARVIDDRIQKGGQDNPARPRS